MIRILVTPPPVYVVTKMREEAVARWTWRRVIDVTAADLKVALYFEDAGVPTQVEIDAFVAAHDPSPQPPPADQAQFTAAVGKLRSTFGTARSVADVNLCLDALTVVCRRLFQELQ